GGEKRRLVDAFALDAENDVAGFERTGLGRAPGLNVRDEHALILLEVWQAANAFRDGSDRYTERRASARRRIIDRFDCSWRGRVGLPAREWAGPLPWCDAQRQRESVRRVYQHRGLRE